MPLEFDDRALNVIGLGTLGVNFLNDDREVVARIFLGKDGKLNIGNFRVEGGENGSGDGGSLDLSSVGFLTIGATGLLDQERVISIGAGLIETDHGGNLTFEVELGTPGTLTQGTANNATSTSHTHAITASADPGANAFILKSTAAGGLTLEVLDVDNVRLDGNTVSAQSGDLTLSAAGGDVVLPSSINIGADNFVSQLTGWRVDYDGSADFRNIYADELHVKAFIADIEQALAGGQIISKSVALLSRDFVVPVGGRAITNVDTTNNWVAVSGSMFVAIEDGQTFRIDGSTGNDGVWTVDHTTYSAGTDQTVIWVTGDITNATADGEVRFRRTIFVEDLPGFADTAVFATNDWIRLRVIDRSGGGLVVADVWGQVGTYTDLSGGEQSWTFTCLDDGTREGETVHAGALALDYGQSGDGWHEITTLDNDSPYARIMTWTTDPTNSANYTLRSQIGNLDGITDSDFPSIGGWGLYSTSAYLKGNLIAAGGDVEITSDGIRLDAEQGKYSSAAVEWYESTNRELSIGTIVDLGVVTGAYVESEQTLSVISTAGSIQLSPSSSVQVASGDFIVDPVGNALRVDVSTGDVGIGVTPSFRLDVQDNAASYVAKFFNDGNASTRHGILIQAGQDANPSNVFASFRDGDGTVVGFIDGDGAGGSDYNTTSDERQKEDIEPLASALDRVLALRPVSYRGKGADRRKRKTPGLIAQEVMAAIPEAANHDEETDLYSLAYNKIIPYLIGAVQELNARVAQLEAAA